MNISTEKLRFSFIQNCEILNHQKAVNGISKSFLKPTCKFKFGR